jgi:hypothetical protein
MTQVPPAQPEEELHVLDMNRPVQPHLLAEAPQGLLGGVVPQHELGRIDGGKPQDHEDDRHDHEHDHGRAQETPHHVRFQISHRIPP